MCSINISNPGWTLSSKIMMLEFVNKLWQAKLLFRCNPILGALFASVCLQTCQLLLFMHCGSLCQFTLSLSLFFFVTNCCLFISVSQAEKSSWTASRISPSNVASRLYVGHCLCSFSCTFLSEAF